MRSHRLQPMRLPRPLDSPGKNTGVGCHFLLQCMKLKSESEVAQSCLTPSDPMDCGPQGSSVHGIFQARVLEWGAIAFSHVCTGNQKNSCDLLYLILILLRWSGTKPVVSLRSAYLRGSLPGPGGGGRSILVRDLKLKMHLFGSW